MLSTTSTRRGIALMCAATLVFAVQDAMSRHLASTYNTLMIVMIRYWFFAAFVTVVSSKRAGGFRAAVATAHPVLQILRGTLLAVEICIVVLSFLLLGLIEAHAVFAVYPLLVAALSGPILGESVGWRRWTAIAIGFVGVLVILQPGVQVFSPKALVPLASALIFAVYGLLTRYVARRDSAEVSFFWTGVIGAVVMSAVGIWHWQPMTGPDWVWMALLCITGATGHYLLIQAYATAEAGAIQPFAYLQLPFATAIAIPLFGETLRPHVALGAAIVVGAGLFTLWRERRRAAGR